MGKKNRGKSKTSSSQDATSAPVDRGTLAQCLNATSQIAAECNSILRDLLRGRYVEMVFEVIHMFVQYIRSLRNYGGRSLLLQMIAWSATRSPFFVLLVDVTGINEFLMN